MPKPKKLVRNASYPASYHATYRTVCLCAGFNFTPVDTGFGEKLHHPNCPHHTDDMNEMLAMLDEGVDVDV